MWFSRVNYARGKGGNVGKHFFQFLQFLTIIIIRGKYRKYRKAFLTLATISHDKIKLVGNIGNRGKISVPTKELMLSSTCSLS